MASEDKKTDRTEDDVEYIGNMWGWKFSLIGLAFMSFLILVIVIRWNNLEVKPESIFTPAGQQVITPEAPQVLQPIDTLKTN